jgi:hypothetical protein
MLKQVILAGTAALSISTAALADDVTTVGRNGAWTIGAGDQVCAMATVTEDYALIITTIRDTPYVMIMSKTGPSSPLKGRAVVTDKQSGDVLMIKSLKSDIHGEPATVLSMTDLIRLWGATVVDMDTRHMVNVKVGDMSFNVDIRGAQEAYQNIKSCAE